MELFVKIISSIQPLIILAKSSILDIWQGSFLESLIHLSKNSFIHGECMFIDESYIFIRYRARVKKIIICNYYQIWLFTFFWLYSLFPNENCELYIFLHSGPLHSMMFQSCYVCYTTVYVCYSVLSLLP